MSLNKAVHGQICKNLGKRKEKGGEKRKKKEGTKALLYI